MKIFKKAVAALAIMAVCGTMVTPVTASADGVDTCAITCPPHRFIQSSEYTVENTTTHEFLYGIIENPDGTITKRWATCTVHRVDTCVDLICRVCGIAEPYYVLDTDITHSACGQ